DGKRDIWQSQPDVFASIANYMTVHGWQKGQTWGREGKVPAALFERLPEEAPMQTTGCLARRQMTVPLALSAWKKLGVRTVTRAALPAAHVCAAVASGES